MEGNRFDQFAMTLGRSTTRRGLIGLLAGPVGLLGLSAAEAKHHKKKRKKKTCQGVARCGKTCCLAGQACVAGTCQYQTYGCTVQDGSCAGALEEVPCPGFQVGFCALVADDGAGKPVCLHTFSCGCQSDDDCGPELGPKRACISLLNPAGGGCCAVTERVCAVFPSLDAP